MPKSMRNLLKYAHNETYVMPENAHMYCFLNKINKDSPKLAFLSSIHINWSL
jgi:hypothetical protein